MFSNGQSGHIPKQQPEAPYGDKRTLVMKS